MKNTNIKVKRAFSLAEVLITLIIVSILMIVLAPMITKSMIKTKGDGIVFTYSDENNTTKENVCFLTQPEYNLGEVEKEDYISTNTCSEYDFTIPNNVNSINLTLVAGGGGGGGAAGGITKQTDLDISGEGLSTVSRTETFMGHLIKSVKINALTGKGTNGTGHDSIKGTTAGYGGKSSSALVGLDIPSRIMRGANYVPSNSTENDITAKITIGTNEAKISIKNTNTNSEVLYSIPYQTTANETEIKQPACLIGGVAANLVYDCGATKSNYFTGSLGTGVNEAETVPTSGTAHLNSVVWGGEGGKIPQIPNGYGWGGKNSDYILSKCDSGSNSQSCTASSDLEYTKISVNEKAGFAYGSITVMTETPGNPGGGGAGGSVIRIKNMAVNAGDTYRIRVGKGGTGGRGGVSDKINSATAGTDGDSGTSTSIYKVNADTSETLVYMVNGGAGGIKGNLNAVNNYTSQAVLSGRNRPSIFTSESDFTGVLTDDETGGRINSTSNESGDLPDSSGAAIAGYLKYNFYNQLPFDYLGYLKAYASGTDAIYNDGAYGGHSTFNTAYAICTPTTGQTVFCGILPRMMSNGSYLYIGGLGGFSGLGSKAGCGGYYVGNNIVNNTGEIVETNKLYTPSDVGDATLHGSDKFSVNDYYDNCTTRTPDGQTADFISPDPLTLKFGSAGSGGGGGGYSLTHGAGRGGNGQNGYVMIDWRK